MEVVNTALAALRERIDHGGMDEGDISTCLDLIEQRISVDTRYRKTHKDFMRAVGETDHESIGALNDILKSLKVERSQADAALQDAIASPSPDDSTPDPSDGDKSSQSEAAEGATDWRRLSRLPCNPSPERWMQARAPRNRLLRNPQELWIWARMTNGIRNRMTKSQSAEASPVRRRRVTRSGSTMTTIDQSDRPRDAIWMSIEKDRIGLAYHLSLAVPDAFPSPNAIKLAAYSHVTEEQAPGTAELTELAESLLLGSGHGRGHSTKLAEPCRFYYLRSLATRLGGSGRAGRVVACVTRTTAWRHTFIAGIG